MDLTDGQREDSFEFLGDTPVTLVPGTGVVPRLRRHPPPDMSASLVPLRRLPLPLPHHITLLTEGASIHELTSSLAADIAKIPPRTTRIHRSLEPGNYDDIYNILGFDSPDVPENTYKALLRVYQLLEYDNIGANAEPELRHLHRAIDRIWRIFLPDIDVDRFLWPELVFYVSVQVNATGRWVAFLVHNVIAHWVELHHRGLTNIPLMLYIWIDKVWTLYMTEMQMLQPQRMHLVIEVETSGLLLYQFFKAKYDLYVCRLSIVHILFQMYAYWTTCARQDQNITYQIPLDVMIEKADMLFRKEEYRTDPNAMWPTPYFAGHLLNLLINTDCWNKRKVHDPLPDALYRDIRKTVTDTNAVSTIHGIIRGQDWKFLFREGPVYDTMKDLLRESMCEYFPYLHPERPDPNDAHMDQLQLAYAKNPSLGLGYYSVWGILMYNIALQMDHVPRLDQLFRPEEAHIQKIRMFMDYVLHSKALKRWINVGFRQWDYTFNPRQAIVVPHQLQTYLHGVGTVYRVTAENRTPNCPCTAYVLTRFLEFIGRHTAPPLIPSLILPKAKAKPKPAPKPKPPPAILTPTHDPPPAAALPPLPLSSSLVPPTPPHSIPPTTLAPPPIPGLLGPPGGGGGGGDAGGGGGGGDGGGGGGGGDGGGGGGGGDAGGGGGGGDAGGGGGPVPPPKPLPKSGKRKLTSEFFHDFYFDPPGGHSKTSRTWQEQDDQIVHDLFQFEYRGPKAYERTYLNNTADYLHIK